MRRKPSKLQRYVLIAMHTEKRSLSVRSTWKGCRAYLELAPAGVEERIRMSTVWAMERNRWVGRAHRRSLPTGKGAWKDEYALTEIGEQLAEELANE